MPAKMSNLGRITFIGYYKLSVGRFSSFTATPEPGFDRRNSLNIKVPTAFNWFKLSVEIAHLWFFGGGIIPFTFSP
jgi:hypothetical protein